MSTYPFTRLRRTRASDWSRRLVSESVVMRNDLIWTIVITDAKEKRTSIPSMPGVDRVNLDEVVSEARQGKVPSCGGASHHQAHEGEDWDVGCQCC